MSLLIHPLLLDLAHYVEQGLSPLRWIDLYSAQYIADCHLGKADAAAENANSYHELVALAVLVSYVSSRGETFLKLTDLPRDILPAHLFFDVSLEELTANLKASDAVSQADSEVLNDKETPLILAQDHLYLARYWRLQQKFEQWLQVKSQRIKELEPQHYHALAEQLKRVFCISDGPEDKTELNWQAIAAAHTLLQSFSLVSGGPGTGKTTTAASLLYLLMQQHQLKNHAGEHEQAPLNVRLLAPTGKAAVKLADSIRHHLLAIESRLSGIDLRSYRVSDCLPDTGETIHRFLYTHGALRENLNQSVPFSSDEVLLGKSDSRKARVDVMIIDEASMIDLALMVELIAVIPDSAQVIMLGDHHQLPAVEPGQIFAECVARFASLPYTRIFADKIARLSAYDAQRLIDESSIEQDVSEAGRQQSVIACQALDSEFHPLCLLRKTYRFDGDLKIAAEQIKLGQSAAFKKQFSASMPDQDDACLYQVHTDQSVFWHNLDDRECPVSHIISAYRDYFECVKNKAALDILAGQFETFQLLCSTHEGPLGVIRLNELIESNYINQKFPQQGTGSFLYHGKAILVTRNHPHLGVFNGDIGFVIENNDDSSVSDSPLKIFNRPGKTSKFQIHFPVHNHTAIKVAPNRLREWQPAYAMTVHKSQGSEYERVGIVLADYARELLSRALLYTALTRSQSRCDIWAESEVLGKAFTVNP